MSVLVSKTGVKFDVVFYFYVFEFTEYRMMSVHPACTWLYVQSAIVKNITIEIRGANFYIINI